MTIETHAPASLETIIIKIGEMKISDAPESVIVTNSLGSSVGISAYDPQLKLGGIVNYLLPEPRSREVERLHPMVFGKLAIPEFINQLIDKGADTERLIVKLAGGSVMNGLNQIMKIGQRNRDLARTIFRSYGIEIAAEADSSNPVRALKLEINTGIVTVEYPLESEVNV
jgi:chemotaxis receptor (MCP) glutamine deamidase CheD